MMLKAIHWFAFAPPAVWSIFSVVFLPILKLCQFNTACCRVCVTFTVVWPPLVVCVGVWAPVQVVTALATPVIERPAVGHQASQHKAVGDIGQLVAGMVGVGAQIIGAGGGDRCAPRFATAGARSTPAWRGRGCRSHWRAPGRWSPRWPRRRATAPGTCGEAPLPPPPILRMSPAWVGTPAIMKRNTPASALRSAVCDNDKRNLTVILWPPGF